MKPTCTRALFPLVKSHIQDWSGCTSCSLSGNRINPVFYRGDVPCVLLFIGDFPDDSANSSGVPFLPTPGLSGCMLDRYIPSGVSWACTYLTVCSSSGSEAAGDVGIAACWERLLSFVSIADPKIICTVGKKSDSQFLKHLPEVINKLNRRPVYIRVNAPSYAHGAKDPDFEVAKAKLVIEKALSHVHV